LNLKPRIILTISIILILIAGSTPAVLMVAAQDATPVPNERIEIANILAEGWETYYQEDYQEAIDSFSQVIEIEPDWVEGYSARAYTYLETGDDAEAIADFTRAAELDSNDSIFYVAIAFLQNNNENYAAAIEAATHALELNPHDASAYSNRAYAYDQTGRYEEAIADYTRSFRADLSDYTTLDRRADIQQTLNNYLSVVLDNHLANGLRALNDENLSEAFSEFTQVISQNTYGSDYDPMYLAYAYYHRGLVHQQFGNLDDAVDDLTIAIEEARDFADAYVARAEVYLDMEQPEDAWADLNRAAEVDPTYSKTYLLRAQLYHEQGDQIEAAADYWRWMQTNQQRDVIWKRYLPNIPFAVDLGNGWVFKIPVIGTAGQVITITADEIEGGLANIDPLIVLLDGDEQPLIADNDSAGGVNAQIVDYVLPADGLYTLAVSHGEQGRGGSILVNLSMGELLTVTPKPTDTLPPTFTATPSITPTPSATYTPTMTATPSITPTLTAMAYLEAAQTAFAARQYQAAVDAYTQAIEIGLESAEIYVGRGKAYGELRIYGDEARADFAHALELDPDNIQALVESAEWELDYNQALTNLNHALELEPDNAAVYSKRGVTYYRRDEDGDNLLAIADFDQALELDPNFAEAYGYKGLTYYYGLGDIEPALENITRMIELAPNDERGYYFRGVIRNDEGGNRQARIDLERAIELDPNYASAHRTLGIVYYDEDDFEEAIEEFTRAVELNPEDEISYAHRGLSHFNLGNYGLAIIDSEQAIVIYPDYSFAYWTLGDSYYALDNFPKAAEYYWRYLAIEGDLADDLVINRARELEARLDITATPTP
jgi:tetratricopeptide (TPR) repeat protein